MSEVKQAGAAGNLKWALIKDTVILSAGMTTANVSNYVFHLLMGRFLGPVNYGVLASLISLMYFIMVPNLALQLVVVRYGAGFHAVGQDGKLNTLFKYLSKRIFVISLAAFFVALLASRAISSFLNIASIWPVAILSGVFLTIYLLPLNRGILQSIEDFTQLSINYGLETVVKMVIGLTLVFIGFSVSGAVTGITISIMLAYAFSLLPLRKILAKPDEPFDIEFSQLIKYAVPVFLALFCLNAYYSVDVILVKHFFSGVNAGHYSGLSILGKIVVFASLAIIGVMFPKVASRHRRNERHSHLLGYALLVVFAISGLIVIVYFLVPKLIIGILFGSSYLAIAPYLGLFGLVSLLIALANVFVNYYLAIRQTGCVPFLLIVAAAQTGLIWWLHGSLAQVVWVMMGSMTLLVAGLAVYYPVVAARPRPPEEESIPIVGI
jgi:O-antigen/teichoic acid export membrane protein